MKIYLNANGLRKYRPQPIAGQKDTENYSANQFVIGTLLCALALLATVSCGEIELRSTVEALPTAGELPRGWMANGAPRTYTPDGLYDLIDGGAELYRDFDVHETVYGEFRLSDKDGDVVTVEIHDMGSKRNAFGIYALEKGDDRTSGDIGEACARSSNSVAFYRGKYYVKLISLIPRKAMEGVERVATGIDGKIPRDEDKLAVLDIFPLENRVAGSERYYRKNIFGFDLLINGFTADYRFGKFETTVFAAEFEDEVSARKAFGALKNETGAKMSADVVDIVTLPLGTTGPMGLKLQGKRIAGATNWGKDPSIRKTLSLFLARLESVK